MLGDGLAMLGKLLPLRLIDRLEAQRMVFALGQVVERGGDRYVLAVHVASAREARVLIGPGARRPKTLVSAKVLKVRLQVLVPTGVLPMKPLLLGVKWIVAIAAGIE